MRSRQDRIIALLMLMPTLILLGVFVYFFLGKTVYFPQPTGAKTPNSLRYPKPSSAKMLAFRITKT